ALSVASEIRAVKRTVEDVGAERLLRLDHALSEMLRVDRADLDMVAIFHQDLRERERETPDQVDVALNEQHSTFLVRDGVSVRDLRGGTEAEEHRFLVIRTRRTVPLLENAFPFVGALVVDSVEHLVEDRLDDGPKVRRTHWNSHCDLL